jgi:mannose-6-phosphate isomerase-like protein (cupin superfamily)
MVSVAINILLMIAHKRFNDWARLVLLIAFLLLSMYEFENAPLMVNTPCHMYAYALIGAIYFLYVFCSTISQDKRVKKDMYSYRAQGDEAYNWNMLETLEIGQDDFNELIALHSRKIYQDDEKMIFLSIVKQKEDECKHESFFDKLIVIRQGNCTIKLRGVSHLLSKGDELFIPKNEKYSITSEKGISCEIIIKKPNELK